MLTSLEWISAVKTMRCVQSDYAVAKILKVSKGYMTSIRHKKSFIGVETAQRVAEELGIDASYVYISAQIERAKTPDEFAMWDGVYQRLGGAQVDENIMKLLNERVMQPAYKMVKYAA